MVLIGDEHDVAIVFHAMQHVQPAVGLAFEHFEARLHAGIGQRRGDFLGRRRLGEQIRPAAGRVGLAGGRGRALTSSPQISRRSAAMSALVLPIVADFDGRKP